MNENITISKLTAEKAELEKLWEKFDNVCGEQWRDIEYAEQHAKDSVNLDPLYDCYESNLAKRDAINDRIDFIDNLIESLKEFEWHKANYENDPVPDMNDEPEPLPDVDLDPDTTAYEQHILAEIDARLGK